MNPITLLLQSLFLLGLLLLILLLLRKIHALSDAMQWKELAFVDTLSGIKNRNAFNKQAERITANLKKSKASFALLLFDIDNFKSINDSSGHLAGDIALKTVSARLSAVFNMPGYSVYRIGGDEFAVISENKTEQELASLLLVLRQIETEKKDITLSKGYAFLNPDEPNAFQAAFAQADKMLYADKLKHRTAHPS